MFITFEYLLLFFIFIVCINICLYKDNNEKNRNAIINRNTSVLLKSVCCIIIVIHHFARRRTDIDIAKPFALGGGFYSLFIFMMLSGYGIVKSEAMYHLKWYKFIRHRILKLLIPVWVITMVSLILYYIIAPYGLNEDLIKEARVNTIFMRIGERNVDVCSIMRCFWDIEYIDGTLWYVVVTIYVYISFLISKTIFSLESKRNEFFIFFTILILGWYIYTNINGWALMYFMNLYALILGAFMATYEERLLRLKHKWLFVFLITNIYIIPFSLYYGMYMYFIWPNMALLSVICSNKLFSLYSIKSNSLIFALSTLSYYIYIVHHKVLTIEWYYMGYISVLVPVIFSIILAFILKMALEKLRL